MPTTRDLFVCPKIILREYLFYELDEKKKQITVHQRVINKALVSWSSDIGDLSHKYYDIVDLQEYSVIHHLEKCIRTKASIYVYNLQIIAKFLPS